MSERPLGNIARSLRTEGRFDEATCVDAMSDALELGDGFLQRSLDELRLVREHSLLVGCLGEGPGAGFYYGTVNEDLRALRLTTIMGAPRIGPPTQRFLLEDVRVEGTSS